MLNTSKNLCCKLTNSRLTKKCLRQHNNIRCLYQASLYNTSSPITKDAIKHFLSKHNIKNQEGVTCFRCINPFVEDNALPTLYINISNGYFCSTNSNHKGGWDKFKELISSGKKELTWPSEDVDNSEILSIWSNTVQFSNMANEELDNIITNFNINHIPLQQFEKHNIGILKDSKTLVIPWFRNNDINKNSPLGLKLISVQDDGTTEKYLPFDNYCHIFGLNNISPKQYQIILTSSEIDAIAINYFFKNALAICLPFGSNRLPLETLPYLERFKEFTIWFGDDRLSFDAALRFSKKLNSKRCKIVTPNQKSSNACHALRNGKDLSAIVRSAFPAEVKNIISFKDLKSVVRNEFHNHEAASGVKWKRFPKLSQLLKGHRRGEFTILTGPTGCGKTTFLSEYSLDLAMNGVSTLWGSFEVNNIKLFKTMMRQYSNCKIEDNLEVFHKAANDFQTLPIQMMSFHGSQDINIVLNTMKQAAYIYDVGHIILDNLQFMMTISTTFDRFLMQDMAIAQIRKFATSENIHVTLVIHPRKEDSMLPLQLTSVFGGGKATQEADNVLIIQNHLNNEGKTRKYLQVVKNRFDGELGRMNLYFNKHSLCMSPPSVPTVKLVDDHDKIHI